MSRLARALLDAVVAAWPELSETGRARALVAVDRFVACPRPSTYLLALREIAECRRAARASALGSALAARSLARGLRDLGALELVAPQTLELLAELPVDLRAGRRIGALAALLISHHELAGRVREADALRGPVVLPTRDPPARHTRRRRSGRRSRVRTRRRS